MEQGGSRQEIRMNGKGVIQLPVGTAPPSYVPTQGQ